MSYQVNKASRVMIFRISCFNPEKDAKPYIRDFELDLAHVKGSMLLNALEAIREEHPELGFRRSCGEGVCGSDGMNINGQNGLACITPLQELPDTVTLRPLPGFSIMRDLIVDMDQFYTQYKKVEPYLQNDRPVLEKEHLQRPVDRAKLDGLYECILCACCSSACPSYWWNSDKFIGPAGLLAAYRFIEDSRDMKTKDRLDALKDPYSVFRCRTVMNCVRVCPKGLNPTKAIGKIRTTMLTRTYADQPDDQR